MSKQSYNLLNAGNQYKWEQFGAHTLKRPYSQGVWPVADEPLTDATFLRIGEKGQWQLEKKIPGDWQCEFEDLKFHIRMTPFGHVGLFPEHALIWRKLREAIQHSKRSSIKALNLFAYTGGASMALRKAGAEVVHVDAAKGIVDWAKENAELNNLKDGIRFIVEDARKFIKRELRRGNSYDIILLDPPSFGRGSKGEVFKVEDDIHELLTDLKDLLSERPIAFVLSSHTPGWTPIVLRNTLEAYLGEMKGSIVSDELCLEASVSGLQVPCGAFASWESQ